ncbi:MAG: ATP12 family protein [Novosphingobium sp.]
MKRFYKHVDVAESDGRFQVLLDNRPVRTVGGKLQQVPTRALAESLAAEWAAQGVDITPATLVLRDMADYAIDAVAPDPAAAVLALLPYGETDTLCYRAEPDEALHERQLAVWEPLLHRAEQRWDVAFERVSGIIHRPQPTATLARLRAVLTARDAFTLAALRSLAGLSASLVIGLLALEPGQDGEALWNAANLEEDWQVELWGKDHEAEVLRARRYSDFTAAMRFAALAGDG